MPSTKLGTGHLAPKPLAPTGGSGWLTPDEDETLPGIAQPLLAQTPPALPDGGEDVYASEHEVDPFGFVAPEPPRRSWAGKFAIVVAAILLVGACIGLGIALAGRIVPQSTVLGSPEATETALAMLRPPVNTPMPLPPTYPASGMVGLEASPTQAVTVALPPTSAPQPPTALPATAPPQPTPVPAQPTPAPALPTTAPLAPTPVPQPAAPTAPPPQVAPSAGVLEARMSLRLDGGQPVGSVSAYSPDSSFSLAVKAAFGPAGVSSLTTRWYGPDGTRIYEMRRSYSGAGTYFAGFSLRKSTPWLPGDYRVDVYTNDSQVPAYSVPFRVVQ